MFHFRYCMTDCAMAIRNAAKAVWPNVKALDCWFHVLKAFDKKAEDNAKE